MKKAGASAPAFFVTYADHLQVRVIAAARRGNGGTILEARSVRARCRNGYVLTAKSLRTFARQALDRFPEKSKQAHLEAPQQVETKLGNTAAKAEPVPKPTRPKPSTPTQPWSCHPWSVPSVVAVPTAVTHHRTFRVVVAYRTKLSNICLPRRRPKHAAVPAWT